MRRGGRARSRRFGAAGIGILILGLLHVPLPQPDFHNVRHHDRPGEVCEHHDHLLRWHPDAGLAQDVALFHWHWIGPDRDQGGPAGLGEGDGPALHAHVEGWDAPTVEVAAPVAPGEAGRFVEPIGPDLGALLALLPVVPHPKTMSRAGPAPARGFAATYAPHASLPCLLQRWTC